MDVSIKTIVLDFYGLPGSGKSTLSHELAQQLIASGKSVCEPSYKLDHNLLKIRRRLGKIGIFFKYSFTHFSDFFCVLTLAAKYSKSIKSTISNTINIITKIYSIEKYNGKFDFIIFDEGIAQAAISMSVGTSSCVCSAFKDILDCINNGIDINLVKVSIDRDEALKRVIKRNSHDTSVEKLRSRELMDRYMQYFDFEVEKISNIEVFGVKHLDLNKIVCFRNC